MKTLIGEKLCAHTDEFKQTDLEELSLIKICATNNLRRLYIDWPSY